MSDRLGIVFLHHNVSLAAEANLRSIRTHNPDATVVTISAGQPMPGGYSLEGTPELQRLHAQWPRQSVDRMVCSWFQQRQEACDRWWLVEWDTYCMMPAREYYRPVWHFPFVATSVRLKCREPEWYWFKRARRLPREYETFAMGAIPFLYLISEAALATTCRMLLDHPLSVGNSEFRFATAANRCGYPACGFSPPNDQITWIPWKTLPDRPMIVHPMKQAQDGQVTCGEEEATAAKSG